MTALGALPILRGAAPSSAARDLALGFAAGVMLAAAFFSLIIPALSRGEVLYGHRDFAALVVCIAMLVGMGVIGGLNEVLPHEHFRTGREGPPSAALRKVCVLFVVIPHHP